MRTMLVETIMEKISHIELTKFMIELPEIGNCIMKNITLQPDDRSYDRIQLVSEEKGEDSHLWANEFNIYGTAITKFAVLGVAHIVKCRIAVRDIEFHGKITLSLKHKFSFVIDDFTLNVTDDNVELEFLGDPLANLLDAQKAFLQHRIAIKLKEELEESITKSVVSLRKSVRNLLPNKNPRSEEF